MDPILVRFQHPLRAEQLILSLPRDTRFSQLTALLYERSFLEPQKPGYRYLYREHLCGLNHTLGDYLPDTTDMMELEIFRFPEVLV